MGLVVDIIESVDNSVRDVGARYFEATADAFGPVLVICATLLVMLVGINMALGIWRMSAADAWQIVTRVILVMVFATSWRNFGVFYDALSDGSAKMAVSFFTGSAPTGAEAMDGFSAQMSDVVDGAAKSVSSIMRGLVAGLLYIILGVLMAAYVLIVVFSKIMIAFLLGVAPMAMVATIFNKTKSLFEAWLSSFIGYLLYPIAAAAVIGAIVSVANEQFEPQAQVEDLSMILGFLCVTFVGIFALMQIPQAAANITGTFNLAGIAPQAIRTVGRPVEAAARAAGARTNAAATGFATGQTPIEAARTRDRSWAERGAAFRQRLHSIEIMRPK